MMADSSMLDALETLCKVCNVLFLFFSSDLRFPKNKVSGIALLDQEGRVSTNISASDLRALSKNSFKDFNRSVFAYLSKSGQGIPSVVSLPQDATLAQAIELMAKDRMHRLYLTNENSR